MTAFSFLRAAPMVECNHWRRFYGIVYLDEVLAINFAADYLILLSSTKIAGESVSRRRLAAAAAVGALYSGAAALTHLPTGASAALKAVCAIIMALIAFGRKERFFRLLIIFIAVSAAYAGVTLAVSDGVIVPRGTSDTAPFAVFIMTFAICWALFSVVFRQTVRNNARGNIANMELCLGGKTTTVPALADTGNMLRDPISGDGVAVFSLDSVLPVFRRETGEILRDINSAGELETLKRLGEKESEVPFFLVPYSSVGNKNGMLLAFRPDEIIINGKKQRCVAAIAPEGIARSEGYGAVAFVGD